MFHENSWTGSKREVRTGTLKSGHISSRKQINNNNNNNNNNNLPG
jgi:hypothetical protein